VAPLAKAMKLKVDTRFANREYRKLARHLLGDPKLSGKTVLVAWHHGTMRELAQALGVSGAPMFKEALFNRVWEVTFDKDGNAKLRDLPQALMPDDPTE
jgi:hypothetical protein